MVQPDKEDRALHMVLYKVLCIAFCFLEIQTQVLVPTPTALRASTHPCQETLLADRPSP